jgi:hypothetical protein
MFMWPVIGVGVALGIGCSQESLSNAGGLSDSTGFLEMVGPQGGGCVDIGGTWGGTGGDYPPVTFVLTQSGCDVTGTMQTTGNCPSRCHFDPPGVAGTVARDTFDFALSNNPWVSCDDCDVLCYGTDRGRLTIRGDRMRGTISVDNCTLDRRIEVTIELTKVAE